MPRRRARCGQRARVQVPGQVQADSAPKIATPPTIPSWFTVTMTPLASAAIATGPPPARGSSADRKPPPCRRPRWPPAQVGQRAPPRSAVAQQQPQAEQRAAVEHEPAER